MQLLLIYVQIIPGSKEPGIKRAFCRKKLNQVFCRLKKFFHLQNNSVDKSVFYARVAIVLIGCIPKTAFGISSIIFLGDPSQAVEKTEKACTFLCKLALFGKNFADSTEGKTAIMWLAFSFTGYGVKSMGLLASPALGTSATVISLLCASVYGISNVVGSGAIGQSKFITTANEWCVKAYITLFGAASLPSDSGKIIDKAIAVLNALKE